MQKITFWAATCAALLLLSSSAFADRVMKFEAFLSGAQEAVFDGETFVPGGTDTAASGSLRVRFAADLSSVVVVLRISNLTGTFSGAHLHCGLPGTNGPVAFGMVSPGPLAFDGAEVRGRLTNSDFTGSDCSSVIGIPVNNIAALAFAMEQGLIYVNVHSSTFGGGEIRGQVFEQD
ncbi:MAG: CHRD domain-containing protein [Gammaproteobacteria bacterium]|uniref:CHRD domain-containing protein n=1 Tax=Pseudomaricurvus alcaniphilus TaxID=1166482 RepID=UPI001409587D|nr:CHRD domain-containing protein [Pseudomaricurvus alcaniphilus]MBR9910863.1 CHRD domain-containing protein [Gammaproteobacteria bacterium]NHN37259.1 CHRD domain-containing protein [Pseudomaricurvus alcaniphilus]